VEILTPGNGRSLYLFDEPSTGLHYFDILRLNEVFRELAGKGNTLLVIDHDPWVLSCCDRKIELGPEGGARGGGFLIRGGE